MENIITTIKINFEELEKWRHPESEVPPCSCLMVYEAIGLLGEIKKYCQDNNLSQICAIEVLYCNFYTLQHLKRFITENWENYDITIKENNKVCWKHGDERREKLNHPHTISDKIKNSINSDFLEYCPGLDEEIEDDDTIVFKIITSDEEDENAVIDV